MKMIDLSSGQLFKFDQQLYRCELRNEHGVVFWPVGVTLHDDDIPFFVPNSICETIDIIIV